jgi:hypothetical protein
MQESTVLQIEKAPKDKPEIAKCLIKNADAPQIFQVKDLKSSRCSFKKRKQTDEHVNFVSCNNQQLARQLGHQL